MAKTRPFDSYYLEYDQWFEEHQDLYRLELLALSVALSPFKKASSNGICLEIGVGSGKFAAPLNCCLGIDPSLPMLLRAKQRGIKVMLGIAEELPVKANSIDYCLMVTTICFVDDPFLAFDEAIRILKPGGGIVIGLVDKDSPLGKRYQEKRKDSKFYKEATFYSCQQVQELLAKTGFKLSQTIQTLLPQHLNRNVVPKGKDIVPGCGNGSFVAISAIKP